MQDQPYEDQLREKGRTLGELFQDSWTDTIPVTPSPEPWHYRNKVEFKIDGRYYDEPPPRDFVRETVVGFRKPGMWYWTFEVNECRIFSPVVHDVLNAVRQWYRAEEVPQYDNRIKEGILRHLVLREAKNTDDLLAIVITSPTEEFPAESFVAALRDAAPFTSIYRGIQHGTPDAATAEELHLLFGEEQLAEELTIPDPDGARKLQFRVSPFGFFQVNPSATELLYGAIRAQVKKLSPPFLYDYYGGAGTIALACADLVPDILSVESFEPASRDGEANVLLNGVDNIHFETEKTEKWLGKAKIEKTFRPEATVILDPPRGGVNPKALRRLGELGPQHIIYVSCNPKMLARELPALTEHFELTHLQAFDLFPHTPHVEVLAFLSKR